MENKFIFYGLILAGMLNCWWSRVMYIFKRGCDDEGVAREKNVKTHFPLNMPPPFSSSCSPFFGSCAEMDVFTFVKVRSPIIFLNVNFINVLRV